MKTPFKEAKSEIPSWVINHDQEYAKSWQKHEERLDAFRRSMPLSQKIQQHLHHASSRHSWETLPLRDIWEEWKRYGIFAEPLEGAKKYTLYSYLKLALLLGFAKSAGYLRQFLFWTLGLFLAIFQKPPQIVIAVIGEARDLHGESLKARLSALRTRSIQSHSSYREFPSSNYSREVTL